MKSELTYYVIAHKLVGLIKAGCLDPMSNARCASD